MSSPRTTSPDLSAGKSRRLLVTGGSGFIGTHLVSRALDDGWRVLNFDVRAPLVETQRDHWRQGDLLDAAAVEGVFSEWRPTAVVHLAARTDSDAPRLEDYRVNTEGTANLLAAAKGHPGLQRMIVTSSQFVVRPGRRIRDDRDFDPHTVYGESKAISERLTREAGLTCIWTIVRPTNIWGPHHPRYPHEFWRVLERGRYVHPGRRPVIRAYGYVGNVVDQMMRILDSPAELVDGRVFYVGDRPIELLEWVNGFSRALTGREARIVPRWLVRTLALGGDIIKGLGLPAPIFSSRYRSMTEDYTVPMEPTLEAFGAPPYSLEEGIAETVRWLRSRR